MMWDDYGMNGWGWGWGLGLLVVIGVVILVIVLVLSLSKSRSSSAPSSSSAPKQILDDRYARGELTTEEYRERLTALGLDT